LLQVAVDSLKPSGLKVPQNLPVFDLDNRPPLLLAIFVLIRLSRKAQLAPALFLMQADIVDYQTRRGYFDRDETLEGVLLNPFERSAFDTEPGARCSPAGAFVSSVHQPSLLALTRSLIHASTSLSNQPLERLDSFMGLGNWPHAALA
jgi:hypothetical protein